MKYLSLCLPTNGVIEWVFPVLDKIYDQKVNPDLYEVIVTDNGDNKEFFEKMTKYSEQYSNLIYKKTNAVLFENQIEALRIASGEYLKFLNHRSVMLPGSIKWLIDLIKENINEKPIIYLSNGVLGTGDRKEFHNFDNFVRGLREYASWTTGVGIWKSDFEKIPANYSYNKISPHSDVLFSERHRAKYIIDDKLWSEDIAADHSKKGRYDLYKAFGCEEITITLQLYIDGDISARTLKYVIKAYENLSAGLYLQFNILHNPCSYILNGFNDAMDIFISKRRVLMKAYGMIPHIVLAKILRGLKKFVKR